MANSANRYCVIACKVSFKGDGKTENRLYVRVDAASGRRSLSSLRGCLRTMERDVSEQAKLRWMDVDEV